MIISIRRRIATILGVAIPQGKFQQAFRQLNREGMLDTRSIVDTLGATLEYLEELEAKHPEYFSNKPQYEEPPLV